MNSQRDENLWCSVLKVDVCRGHGPTEANSPRGGRLDHEDDCAMSNFCFEVLVDFVALRGGCSKRSGEE